MKVFVGYTTSWTGDRGAARRLDDGGLDITQTPAFLQRDANGNHVPVREVRDANGTADGAADSSPRRLARPTSRLARTVTSGPGPQRGVVAITLMSYAAEKEAPQAHRCNGLGFSLPCPSQVGYRRQVWLCRPGPRRGRSRNDLRSVGGRKT